MSLERAEQIDRLLHDAESKDGGAWMARLMHDESTALQFVRDRDALLARAHSLDPHHVEAAWRETEGSRSTFLDAVAALTASTPEKAQFDISSAGEDT